MSKAEIIASINTLAEQIKETLTTSATGAVIPDDTFIRFLPEGMSIDQVNSVYDHVNKVFTPAAIKAVGQVDIKCFKDNPELNATQHTINIGDHARLNLQFDRATNFNNPKDPDNKVTKHCATTFHVQLDGISGNHIKEIKAELSKEALAAYGS